MAILYLFTPEDKTLLFSRYAFSVLHHTLERANRIGGGYIDHHSFTSQTIQTIMIGMEFREIQAQIRAYVLTNT